MSKTSTKVKNAWNARNYDSITIVVPKGTKEKLKKIAEKKGYKSMGEYIKRLIADDSALLLFPEK